MFGDCIDELIDQNPAVESTECDSEDIIIKKKELITHKLYCPLKIQVCDEDSDYEYEDVSSSDLIGYEYEINDDIENSFGQIGANENERERGLMAYTWYPRLDALVYSAFPKVEERGGRMYGVLEYQSYGELPAADLIDFIGEMTGQFSDGWGEGYEQDAVELDGKEYYISFWNSDHYYLKPEEEVFPQPNVEMKM